MMSNRKFAMVGLSLIALASVFWLMPGFTSVAKLSPLGGLEKQKSVEFEVALDYIGHVQNAAFGHTLARWRYAAHNRELGTG